LQVQAHVLLKLYNQAYSIALVSFAFFDLLIGYLVFKSTFLPRILGVMMSLAGLAFLAFLAPAFGARNLQWILPLAVGEGLIILWLLVKAVDAERWKASSTPTPAP
jgi:predicted transporter